MYCNKCGTELLENSKFCNKCGYEINSKINKFKIKKSKIFFILTIITVIITIFFICYHNSLEKDWDSYCKKMDRAYFAKENNLMSSKEYTKVLEENNDYLKKYDFTKTAPSVTGVVTVVLLVTAIFLKNRENNS